MKKEWITAALELAIVLLVTQIAFVWGKCTALIERGYAAYGGEYLFLLIPAIYHIIKRIAADWIAEIRRRRGGGKHR